MYVKPEFYHETNNTLIRDWCNARWGRNKHLEIAVYGKQNAIISQYKYGKLLLTDSIMEKISKGILEVERTERALKLKNIPNKRVSRLNYKVPDKVIKLHAKLTDILKDSEVRNKFLQESVIDDIDVDIFKMKHNFAFYDTLVKQFESGNTKLKFINEVESFLNPYIPSASKNEIMARNRLVNVIYSINYTDYEIDGDIKIVNVYGVLYKYGIMKNNACLSIKMYDRITSSINKAKEMIASNNDFYISALRYR